MQKKKTLIEIVDSNHKNSMAGQSIVAELAEGDRVQVGISISISISISMVLQVYMYTHTGLMDKKSNWFTHFIGMFLRPKDFMVSVLIFSFIHLKTFRTITSIFKTRLEWKVHWRRPQ